MNDQFRCYVTMDEAARRKLLEGIPDCITPLREQEQKFLDAVSCPKCGISPCLATIDPQRPFGGPNVLPRRIMKCPNCDVTFDPYTGIQLTLGRVPHSDVLLSQMFIDGKKDQ